MEKYIRAEVSFNTSEEIATFVANINKDGTTDRYTLENEDGSIRVSARSLMGVIYMAAEVEKYYLVNDTNPTAALPVFIDAYRV